MKDAGDGPRPVHYAVIDPSRECGREMIAVLGTDAVELVSTLLHGPPWCQVLEVRVPALGEDSLVRLCRMLAARRRLTEAGALLELVHGRGLSICAACCYVCRDPATARAFFADRDREGGEG